MMLTAKDARKLIEDYEKQLEMEGNEKIQQIMKAIQKHASKGESSTNVGVYLNKVELTALRNLGYTVKSVVDQRDGDYTVISWGKSYSNSYDDR